MLNTSPRSNSSSPQNKQKSPKNNSLKESKIKASSVNISEKKEIELKVQITDNEQYLESKEDVFSNKFNTRKVIAKSLQKDSGDIRNQIDDTYYVIFFIYKGRL